MQSRVLEEKVHFYEHYSLEKFEEYFRGAFYYVTNIVFEKMVHLVNFRYYKDEILLALESLIQGFFLFRHSATYAEYFYDFKRVTLKFDPLSKKSKLLTLILQTFTPYLKTKLNRHFNQIQAKINNYSILTSQEQLFRKIYPYIAASLRLINFFNNAKFLLDPLHQIYSIDYLLLSQQLIRINTQQQQQSSSSPAIEFMKKYLVFGLFLAFQGMDWYYRSNARNTGASSNQRGSNIQEPIPPPTQNQSSQGSSRYNTNSFCQICRKKLKNPAALVTSGYVFCFGCIAEYVKNFKKCPVTSIPSMEQQIVRVFSSVA